MCDEPFRPEADVQSVNGSEDSVSAEALPTADIRPSSTGASLGASVNLAVKKPRELNEDFFIQVQASTIRRCREDLAAAKSEGSGFSDLYLALGSGSLGIFSSAAIAGLTFSTTATTVAFYVAIAIVTTISATLYFSAKRARTLNIKRLSNKLLDHLPDPEEAVELSETQ